jgi:hypothetical protein
MVALAPVHALAPTAGIEGSRLMSTSWVTRYWLASLPMAAMRLSAKPEQAISITTGSTGSGSENAFQVACAINCIANAKTIGSATCRTRSAGTNVSMRTCRRLSAVRHEQPEFLRPLHGVPGIREDFRVVQLVVEE